MSPYKLLKTGKFLETRSLIETVKLLLTGLTLALCWSEFAFSAEDLKPWPPAEAGYERMVFRLPVVDNENDHKLEIVIGQQRMIDCNLHHLSGNLETHSIDGWGYPLFRLDTVGVPISTMMACPPDMPQHNAFVAVRGNGFMQRYNSKLPVVVYVPAGFEVRYRIWSAGNDYGQASPE